MDPEIENKATEATRKMIIRDVEIAHAELVSSLGVYFDTATADHQEALLELLNDTVLLAQLHKYEHYRKMLASLSPAETVFVFTPVFASTIHISSNVNAVGRCLGGHLFVRFNDKSVYGWESKAKEHYTSLISALSPGGYIHKNLPKGKRLPN